MHQKLILGTLALTCVLAAQDRGTRSVPGNGLIDSSGSYVLSNDASLRSHGASILITANWRVRRYRHSRSRRERRPDQQWFRRQQRLRSDCREQQQRHAHWAADTRRRASRSGAATRNGDHDRAIPQRGSRKKRHLQQRTWHLRPRKP
jgi:hypothetical protein